jgi:hypothetical protein
MEGEVIPGGAGEPIIILPDEVPADAPPAFAPEIIILAQDMIEGNGAGDVLAAEPAALDRPIMGEDLPPLKIIEIEHVAPVEELTVERPAEPPLLTISADDIPTPLPTCVVTFDDLVEPTLIGEPVDLAEVPDEPLTVTGTAEPCTELLLTVQDYAARLTTDEQGRFAFQNVRLQPEWNIIVVEAPAYAKIAKCKAMVRAKRLARPLMFVGLEDPYSRHQFTADDDVVRCRHCGTFALRRSWEALKGCSFFGCPGKTFWTPENPEFFEPQRAIEV